ncbi:hypothetical protein FANTH_6489 [Fusarium anthophilum]|uniref:Uncharacterized protein n=1 Tax=Fusarium anthophilum TaxID=48485 RepID=A0A8H4ZJ27_9HYPO|nr:hypothetical protein FANTH_6489 [Fusarium anthophilum]
MVTQEEQSRKRKSGEAQIKTAARDARKSEIGPKIFSQKPKHIHTPVSSTYSPEDYEYYGYYQWDPILEREADPPVSSARTPKERQLNRPSGTSSATSSANFTPQCGLFWSTRGPTCAGCGSSSHRLNLCMQAGSSSGLMKGCPWCNTLEHSLASCPETKHDLAMQFELIQMRANMPSFQPTQDWVDVVRAAVADGHKPPNSFPWTAHFTIKLYKSL